MTLSDPNDDGRFEVMLAIWRKDRAGYERSQPYFLGYPSGDYVLLWGAAGGRSSPIGEEMHNTLDTGKGKVSRYE